MKQAANSIQRSATPMARSAFTLTEMMIAIALLLVVIIATSQIFGTASKVTGIGQATQSVITEAAAIEQQLRADLAGLSTEGVFAIRCTAVRNDVKGVGQPLLNPNLPNNALIRSDQLLFFSNGRELMQGFRLSDGNRHKGTGTATRIYYGHGFQLPFGPAYVATDPSSGNAFDANPNVTMTPWYNGTVQMGRTLFSTIGGATLGTNIYQFTLGPTINASQPEARQWLLARQAVVLGDDDQNNSNVNSKTFYLQNGMARSIFFNAALAGPLAVYGHTREVRNGRMDGAASLLNEIQKSITIAIPAANPPGMRDWFDTGEPAPGDQRVIIRNHMLYYPRAERKAPSMHRVDQALTNHVISGACSSFTVDWTYAKGTGEVLDAQNNIVDPDGVPGNGDELFGVGMPFGVEQPWFGMPNLNNFPANTGLPDPQRGTMPYFNWPDPANTFYTDHIDDLPIEVSPGVYVYEAFFGYNHNQPLDPATGTLWPFNSPQSYTPWPTALRITMTLHDADTRLEGGREIQFVIDLPRQKK